MTPTVNMGWHLFTNGKPADLYSNFHPDWAPSIMMTDEERHHRADE
ncbi:hypothetical protein LSH36_110g03075 [Paralvinella palmiformis]|uniref:Uncharacterized protein n=1 Tax=Paralvinella palmiformis TaxID=53620 RepID=A0AAD9NC35_9ANNE|nr:hypothetical protein LSH36_110g03075 [Paralvinella palmiformis]